MKGNVKMLKVVVFDGGFGGELFADYIEEKMPILDVIRVIDWRNANQLLKNTRVARKATEAAIKPYIGRVDLIVFANLFVAITSLKYFRKKYAGQKFIGLGLPEIGVDKDWSPVLVLTTRTLAKSLKFRQYLFRTKRRASTVCLDEWPGLIDDGELSELKIRDDLRNVLMRKKDIPGEIVLGCSQFRDIENTLYKIFEQDVKIRDDFKRTFIEMCDILKLRGARVKRKK